MVTKMFIAWENISIVLNKVDQSFYHSGGWQYQATGGKMSTLDGGKTWNFTTLNVLQTRPK
jgi:nucleosome binding factor SPN SPT16 subunit